MRRFFDIIFALLAGMAIGLGGTGNPILSVLVGIAFAVVFYGWFIFCDTVYNWWTGKIKNKAKE